MKAKILFAGIISATVFACNVRAAIILQLVVDPFTTAFADIPPADGFTGLSTQAGPGRWHLYVVDDNSNSFGVSSYDIRVSGATTSLHRSPTTFWNDAEENGPFNAGFGLLRNSNNNPVGTFQAAQPLPGSVPVLITGFGQTASNFAAEIPQAVEFQLTTSGQWGNYANIAPYRGKNWLFIGEGAYSPDSPPSLSAAQQTITYYRTFSELSPVEILPNCYRTCIVPPPPPVVVDDLDLGNVTRGTLVTAMLEMHNWDRELFDWTLASFNGVGASVDPDTGEFTWDSTGAPLGHYAAVIWALGGKIGGDNGTLTFNLIPEPATASLLGFLLLGVLGIRARQTRQ